MKRQPQPWNHNLHYHRVILEAIPRDCERVLDIGCGEGILTRELGRNVRQVCGIDLDGPSVELARAREVPGVAFVLGDFLTHPFEPVSFDAIASVAALHHMDAGVALNRMAGLLKPGGTLAIVGLARSDLPRDAVYEFAAVVANRRCMWTKTYWEHSAPMVWPPPHTYAEMRRIAQEVLPGVRYRRHLLWRYSLVWTKPAGPQALSSPS